MLFKAAVLRSIAKGTVTEAYRHWRRPTVRAGGTLRTAIGVLQIETMEPVLLEELELKDAHRSGFASLEALLDSVKPQGEGVLYRIRFRRVSDDRREALRAVDHLDYAALQEVSRSLARLDRDAPWTGAMLHLIAKRDGTTAAEIAMALGLEKPVVKRRVRQLKELGLTESLASGYRLAPRGRAVLPSWPPSGETDGSRFR